MSNVTEPTVTPEGVVVPDDERGVKLVSRYIDLLKITRDTDTGQFYGTLEYDTPKGLTKKRVARDVYSSPEALRSLVNTGIDITRTNSSSVYEALKKREDEMWGKAENEHFKLGFGELDGQLIFKLFNCIGIESTYAGTKAIAPHGTYEEYSQLLDSYILTSTPLTFVLVASLSTVILAYMGERFDFENYIIHMAGQSSSGKTTAAMLAVSPYASPDIRKDTLIASYNATENALIKFLDDFNGIPCALDEISTSRVKNFTATVYNISTGTDKKRCNSDATLMKTGTWRTIVFSTGEQSLLGRSNKNEGLRMRVFEFFIDKWTADAATSGIIKRIILENYGQLGFKFAQIIMGYDKNILYEKIQKKHNFMMKRLDKEGVTDRFSDRRCLFYALILATKDIMIKKLGMDIDSKSLIKFLIETENTAKIERNSAKEFIEFLNNYVIEHNSHFNKNPKNMENSYGLWGWVAIDEHGKTVTLLKNSFICAVSEFKHENYKTMAKALREAGYLISEDGTRNMSRKVVNKERISVYIINLSLEE